MSQRIVVTARVMDTDQAARVHASTHAWEGVQVAILEPERAHVLREVLGHAAATQLARAARDDIAPTVVGEHRLLKPTQHGAACERCGASINGAHSLDQVLEFFDGLLCIPTAIYQAAA